MEPGKVILELGANSGVASIIFALEVSSHGTVFAFEADQRNLVSANLNIKTFNEANGFSPDIVNCAILSKSGIVTFVVEGNKGSAVVNITNRHDKSISSLAITFSVICKLRGVERVVAIKADSEDAESEFF